MPSTIDKGIPMPYTPISEKYPIADMEIGDSILIEAKSLSVASITFSAQARAIGLGATHHFRSKYEGTKIRVWRVAP